MGLTLQLMNQIDRAEESLEGRSRKKGNRAELGIPLQRRRSAEEENERTQGMSSQQLYDDHKQRLGGEESP